MENRYDLKIDKKVYANLSFNRISRWLFQNKIEDDSLVYRRGLSGFRKISQLKEFEDVIQENRAKLISTMNVLVVEDDKLSRETLKEILSEQGFNVVDASSAYEALDKVKEYKFHLAFIDIKMPGMGGVELLGILRKKIKLDFEVIIITGFSLPELEQKALDLGVDCILRKPFSLSKIYDAVDRLLPIKKKGGGAPRMSTIGQIFKHADILKQYKVLIVDDEEVLCEFLADNLKKDGFNVHYLCREDEALEHLENNSDCSVLLVDLKLKETSGFEVIEKARKINPEIIFIIITGYPDLSSAVSAIKKEVFSFIIKPFNVEEVKITVRNALEKYYLMEQNKKLMEDLRLANQDLMTAKNKLEGINKMLNTEVEHKEEELVEVHQALEDRKIVEIAKGILMKRLRLSEDEAMRKLQEQSRKARCKIAHFASLIVKVEKAEKGRKNN